MCKFYKKAYMFKRFLFLFSVLIFTNSVYAEPIKGGVAYDYDKNFAELNYSVELKPDNMLFSDEVQIKNSKNSKYTFTNFKQAPDKYEISLSTGKTSAKTSKAIELKEMLQKQPDNRELLFAYAIQLRNEKKFNEAMNTVNKILEIDSEHALAHFLKGDILRNMDKFKEAAEEYLYTTQLNPYCADAYYNIAKMLELLNDRELALDYYKMAYQANPKDEEIKEIIFGNYIDM